MIALRTFTRGLLTAPLPVRLAASVIGSDDLEPVVANESDDGAVLCPRAYHGAMKWWAQFVTVDSWKKKIHHMVVSKSKGPEKNIDLSECSTLPKTVQLNTAKT